ncbi:MAG TPA: tetratricopeptide repeat protein, partial [Flavobacteriaceae bacterium]|nr:tetratricopeptide repeat protein [Flavobacteriaceae bacterium]
MRLRLLTGFLLLGVAVFSQEKERIDSINNLYIQGLNIPPDSILAIFQKNIKDAEKIGYEKGLADAYSSLGYAYSYQGKYDETTKYSLKAIRIFEKLGMQNRIASYYAGLGYTMKYLDFEKAEDYMQKGMAIAELNHFEDELKDIYNNYGVLKEINHELDSA